MVIPFFLFYLISGFSPFYPVVLFLWCAADVWIVYWFFIAQSFCGVTLTSVMDWVCCLIFKDGPELEEPQSINSCNWFLIPTDHPQCVWLIQPYELAAPSQDRSQLLSTHEGAQTFRRSYLENRTDTANRQSCIFNWLAECINAHFFNFTACAHQ